MPAKRSIEINLGCDFCGRSTHKTESISDWFIIVNASCPDEAYVRNNRVMCPECSFWTDEVNRIRRYVRDSDRKNEHDVFVLMDSNRTPWSGKKWTNRYVLANGVPEGLADIMDNEIVDNGERFVGPTNTGRARYF